MQKRAFPLIHCLGWEFHAGRPSSALPAGGNPHDAGPKYDDAVGNIEFAWDRRKARSNLVKHGVSFEEAPSVFLDERARLIDDPDHSGEEERVVLLGY